jgi:acetyltransferase-like isoleucine patch superfamily enzyme
MMSSSNFTTGSKPGPGQVALEILRELLPVRLSKLTARGLSCEIGVFVKTPSRLVLGRDVTLQRRALLHCGGKKWCDYGGGIELGDGVVIGPNCVLYGAGTIQVGAYSHLGPGSMLIAQCGDVNTRNRLTQHIGHVNDPIILGKGVWIGAGAVILGNTVLGDHCVVSANSVVSGHFPAGTTLIGNPARVAKRSDNK